MGVPTRRLSIAAGSLTVGGFFLGAAALFHFLAASHLPAVLKEVLNAKQYAFLQPIVSFTFLLNGVLLLPLSFSTLYSAAGVRRGERWAWWICFANAGTVIVLPGLLLATMGLGYFSAPLFLAGAVSITVAGLLMMLPLLWARRDIERPS